ncbi:MAG: FadR family transcriptional regulator, partial [Chloroflexi bacterium]|nr:FadR family transcriptional regulator [Chloroflexota bacterium]
EQLDALRELVERSRMSLDDPPEFAVLAVGFHQAVAECCGNRALRASLAALRSTQLKHMGPPTTPPIAHRVAQVHGAILDAIVARDAGLARRCMLEHLAALSSAAHAASHAAIAASV